MKILRAFIYFSLVLLLAGTQISCSPSRASFRFQPSPATPKVTPVADEPIYTASLETATPDLHLKSEKTLVIRESQIDKKALRKMLKKTLAALPDTTLPKKKDSEIVLEADKAKLREIKKEVEGLKDAVTVEKEADKVVIKYKDPTTGLSDSTKIILALGTVLVLLVLFSLPFIGTLLTTLISVLLVALVLAIVLDIIKIQRN